MEKTQSLARPETMAAEKKDSLLKRRFYDGVFALGFLCAVAPGVFPNLSTPFSIALCILAAISFFDDNLYLYMGLFVYLRYRLMIGGFAAYRVYSLILAARLIKDFARIKLQVVHFPALLIFFLHCAFALGTITNFKQGMYVFVDSALIYLVLCVVTQKSKLMRRFFFALMLGAVTSGIYGWATDAYTVDIHIRGAGAHKVNRNFGALSDSNFAGLLYSLCIVCTLVVKKVPIWLKCVFVALFGIMLLQTASLSALLTLTILVVFLIILKYRAKAFLILLGVVTGLAAILGVLLAIPQFREIDAIAGLIIRFHEKLGYIANGEWNLLTTGRVALWMDAVHALSKQDLIHLLFGGNVVTVNHIDPHVMSEACHNSYLQGALNFGILGVLLVYLPLFALFFHRILRHYTKEPGYENEDLAMLQLCFSFAFIVFGMTVDFFIDWPYMMLYFF